MLKAINKLFTETLKLDPDMWLIIFIAIVAIAFAVTLIAGLLTGEFNAVKGNMKRVISNPKTVVSVMQKMPVAIKKQYKHARLTGAEPSMFVTEKDCVVIPYKRSLLSKSWLVTFVATVVCGVLAFFIIPVSVSTVDPETVTDLELLSAYVYAPYLAPFIVFAVGGLLTFVAALVAKIVESGAHKTYERFVPALDGEAPKAATQTAGGKVKTAKQKNADKAQSAQEATQTFAAEPQDAYSADNTLNEDNSFEPYVEPVPQYEAQDAFAEDQPVTQNATAYSEPVVMQEQESDEEIRRRAREEALEQAKAAQAAQAEAQARAMAQAKEQQAQAVAAAQAAAARAQAAASQDTASANAAPTEADALVARINQIEREGASREVMRDVATQLQRERAKPENKTPAQQKKLNEALSKLLKAMSASTRK